MKFYTSFSAPVQVNLNINSVLFNYRQMQGKLEWDILRVINTGMIGLTI